MSKQGALILVVDDEREILRVLQRGLEAYGYRVVAAASGEAALRAIFRLHPDLVVLDLLLPGISGLEFCRQVREISSIPIIVLSVKDAEQDKVDALDLGADDYIAKPFYMNEVLARIRVALRRIARLNLGTEPRFQTGSLLVDFERHQVWLNDQELSLSPIEYDLLKVFITHRGKLLTRQKLVQEVWGSEDDGRDHSLHVSIARLRQKIEPDPDQQYFITTTPGVGYRFHEARAVQAPMKS